MMLYSMMDTGKAYLNGDVLTLKLNSMGNFMVSTNPEMMELITSRASKLLGYNITLNLTTLDKSGQSSSDSFPEI